MESTNTGTRRHGYESARREQRSKRFWSPVSGKRILSKGDTELKVREETLAFREVSLIFFPFGLDFGSCQMTQIVPLKLPRIKIKIFCISRARGGKFLLLELFRVQIFKLRMSTSKVKI